MRWLIIAFFIIGYSTYSFSQNLVLNPSFENMNFCPWEYSQFFSCKSWKQPTFGTSDYYNSCGAESYPETVKIPTNFFGNQPTQQGDAYAGIYVFYKNNYREYLQGKLSQPLEKGKQYKLTFYTSLADKAGVAIKEFGVAFSDSTTRLRHDTVLAKPYIPIGYQDSFLKNKDVWQQLVVEYEAQGGEQYFIIGNFKNNQNTDTLSVKNELTPTPNYHVAYYYIDEVCLGEVLDDETCICINNGNPPIVSTTNYVEFSTIETQPEIDNSPKVGDIVILRGIYFDFDKATLHPRSEAELNRLYHLLLEYPNLEIVIKGHTDDKGSKAYNKSLSEARALAVYAYLVKKGINSSRLDFKGYGENKPIASNNDPDGRQLNRRVEFEVVAN